MAVIGKINIWNTGPSCRHSEELKLCERACAFTREWTPGRDGALYGVTIFSSAHITSSDHQRAHLKQFSNICKGSTLQSIYSIYWSLKLSQGMVWSDVNIRTDVLCTGCRHAAAAWIEVTHNPLTFKPLFKKCSRWNTTRGLDLFMT